MNLRSKFFSHIITLLTGSAAAQIITFISYIILARIYLPENFGVFAIFTATAIIISELINGRYDLSIFLPETDRGANNLVALCIIIAVTLSAVLLIAIFPVNIILINSDVNEQIVRHLYLLPVSVLMAGIIQPVQSMMNRLQNYRSIAIARVAQAITMAAVSIWAGTEGYFLQGLIWGFIAGQFMQLIFISAVFIISNKIFFNNISLAEIKEGADKYRQFPRYSLSSNLLNTISRQSPFYLLGLFYGTDVTGYFSMAHKLLMAPVALISGSYAQVFYERAVKINNKAKNQFKSFIINNIKTLVLIAFIPLVIILFWGVDLAVIILGEKWQQAGLFLIYLAPWTFTIFVTTPLTFVFDVKTRLKDELYYHLTLSTARITVLITGGLFAGAAATVIMFSATGLFFNLFLIYYILKISNETSTPDSVQ